MSDDLHRMGEDLISISARVVRWAPAEQAGVSVAAARILSRLRDAGQMKISDLAVAERSSQPTITNHIKPLVAAGLLTERPDPSRAGAKSGFNRLIWTIDQDALAAHLEVLAAEISGESNASE